MDHFNNNPPDPSSKDTENNTRDAFSQGQSEGNSEDSQSLDLFCHEKISDFEETLNKEVSEEKPIDDQETSPGKESEDSHSLDLFCNEKISDFEETLNEEVSEEKPIDDKETSPDKDSKDPEKQLGHQERSPDKDSRDSGKSFDYQATSENPSPGDQHRATEPTNEIIDFSSSDSFSFATPNSNITPTNEVIDGSSSDSFSFPVLPPSYNASLKRNIDDNVDDGTSQDKGKKPKVESP
ncbi:hypothetical protein ACFE04_013902 [Oxalis oulophora]